MRICCYITLNTCGGRGMLTGDVVALNVHTEDLRNTFQSVSAICV